ncbi:MAG: hypothetical protein PHT53_00840 [Candidatus Omnitrophica bacterium]|nr:hypothetical protein [Candidatus Omnitrophota bacterium]
MDKKFSYLFILSIFLISGIAAAQPAQKTSDEQAAADAQQPPAKAATDVPAIAEGTPKTAEQPKEEVVKGIIKEIAADGSFIVIDNTKVLTTKEFLDDSYLEVGDNVEVTAEMTDAGLKAKNYNYIFEEEGPSAIPEEPPSGEPQGY